MLATILHLCCLRPHVYGYVVMVTTRKETVAMHMEAMDHIKQLFYTFTSNKVFATYELLFGLLKCWSLFGFPDHTAWLIGCACLGVDVWEGYEENRVLFIFST